MKPITADNAEGRTLLALRAGPMTVSELNARNGTGVAGWLIKAGYVTQDDSYYRLTEAGRAACPYRNPLAAPGVVQAATFKPEIDMSKKTVVTRQQVLAVIVEAGASGITRKDLIEHFGCPEANIDMHLVNLNRQTPPVVFKPKVGTVCAIQFKQEVGAPAWAKPKHATREAILEWLKNGAAATASGVAAGIGCSEESTEAVLRGLYAGLKVDRAHDADLDDYRYFIGTPKMETQSEPIPTVNPEKEPKPESPAVVASDNADAKKQLIDMAAAIDPEALQMPAEAFETIEVKGIPDRRAPVALSIQNVDEFEVSISSDGTMALMWEEDMDSGVMELSKAVVIKMRRFLGLFQGVV